MTIAARITATEPGNLQAFWKFIETSGTNADDSTANNYDATYSWVVSGPNTNPDGDPAQTWNGTTYQVDASSSGVEASFNGAEGTILIWARVAGSSVWTDLTRRDIVNFAVDANNFVRVYKGTTDNNLTFNYKAGGTLETVLSAQSSTDWMQIAITWSKAADEVKTYVNGVQTGSTQTGLGTWAGTLATMFIGSSGAANYWKGDLSLCAVWDKALTAGQIDFILNNNQGYYVYVDWDQDGTYTDMSAYVLSVRGMIGRRNWQQRVADVGICTIELDNTDREFSPDNSGGTYYGQLVPNIPMYVEIIDGAGPHRVVTMWTDTFVPEPGLSGTKRCLLTCIDRIGQLRNADIALPIQQSQTTGATLRKVTSTVYSSGQATGTVYMRGVADTHTLTVDTTVYTFLDTITAAANDLGVATQDYFYNAPSGGGGITDAAVNAAAAINRDEGNGTHYSEATSRQLNVTALGYMGIGLDESNYDTDYLLQETAAAYQALACSFSWAFNGVYTEPVFLPFRRVYLYLKKVGSPTGTLTLRHETPTGAGGSPSGTLYNASGTVTMAEADLTTSFAWYAFDWPAEYQMENYSLSGVSYLHWLVLSTDRATSSTNYVVWGGISGSAPVRFSDDTKTGGAWAGRTANQGPLIFIPGLLDLTASAHGAWGNSLALAQTGNQMVVSGATFSGGVDGPSGFIDADTGVLTLDYAGDTWVEGDTNGLSATYDITYSEVGLLWAARNGTITFRDKTYVFTQTNSTAELTCNNNHVAQEGRLSSADIINRVTVNYEPRAVLTAAVIAQANHPFFITGTASQPTPRWNAYDTRTPDSGSSTPGQRTVTIPYVTVSTGDPVGGLSITQPLEAGTDYELWGTKDKTGPEVTDLKLVKFALALVASGVEVQMTNTAGRWGWVHDLQVRGTALYRQDRTQDVREDTTSITTYGLHPFTYDFPFPSADVTNYAEVLAWYYINRFKDPKYFVTEIGFKGTDLIGGVSVFALELGDIIKLTETQTAISGYTLMVIGMEVLFVRDNTPEITFYVEQLATHVYWQLGTTNLSELGTTTYLGL